MGHDPCPFCGHSATRYDWDRECCRVRYVAGLPRLHRQAFYRALAAREGEPAAQRVMAAVKEFFTARLLKNAP